VDGDAGALPPLRAGERAPTTLASPAALAWLQHCRVGPHRRNSDHPVEALLATPWAARCPPPPLASPSAAPAGSRAQPLRTLLRSGRPPSRPRARPRRGGGVQACWELLVAEAERAAAAAGRPRRAARCCGRSPARPGWFYGEHRRLKAAYRRSLRWAARSAADAGVCRTRLRLYARVVRSRRRAWALRLAQSLLRELRHDPRALYQRARPPPLRLPAAPQDPAPWTPFVTQLAQGPAAAPARVPRRRRASPRLRPAPPQRSTRRSPRTRCSPRSSSSRTGGHRVRAACGAVPLCSWGGGAAGAPAAACAHRSAKALVGAPAPCQLPPTSAWWCPSTKVATRARPATTGRLRWGSLPCGSMRRCSTSGW